MAAPRLCAECKKPLINADGSKKSPIAKTCGSSACKSRRARRLKKARKRVGDYPVYDKAVKTIAPSSQVKDVGKEVLREELRPLIQDAITEDVTKALADMVALTADAIAVLKDDLTNKHDLVLRQRSAALILRYTAGNDSIAPRREEDKPQPMQVVFNVPGGPSPAHEEADIELLECVECHEHKPSDEFVAGSERCQACHDAVQAKIAARFAS